MRIVAVATLDAVVKHFALNERAVNVIFVADLTVSVIERFGQKLQRMIVVEVAAGFEIRVGDGSSRMTRSTSLNLVDVAIRFQFRQTHPMILVPKWAFR